MRKPKFKRHQPSADPMYQDVQVSQFVNNLMREGKKMVAYTIFYDALREIEEKTEQKGIEVWRQALENIMPSVEVKSRRVGGSTFQVPLEVRSFRRVSLGMKWLIRFSRKRHEHSMSRRLAAEIIAASKGEGATVKKKEEVHRMAESNKAFSHFRF